MNKIDPTQPARDRLIAAATDLFSQKGFAGASVRDICARAGTGSNMIHHYFGSKQGLYDEILTGLSESVLVVPIRIIADPPKSREHLISRLEIFVEETVEALISRAQLFELVVREQIVFDVFDTYNRQLVSFFEAAKTSGFVRAELDAEMLTGLILDRVGNQILYATAIEKVTGKNIATDVAYRNRWLRANLDLIFNGILN